MINEESKMDWLKIGIVALITFLVAYLAFHLAIKHNLKKINSPFYQAEQMEKFLAKEQRDLERYDLIKMQSPFEAKMRPMMVNLVKELNEYKVIIDLSQFNNDENAVNVTINNDELTVKGEIDKKIRGSEKIIRFTQTYYLNENLDETKITKERKGDKYIVTIPFKTKENND